jgi:hypothetical protein
VRGFGCALFVLRYKQLKNICQYDIIQLPHKVHIEAKPNCVAGIDKNTGLLFYAFGLEL